MNSLLWPTHFLSSITATRRIHEFVSLEHPALTSPPGHNPRPTRFVAPTATQPSPKGPKSGAPQAMSAPPAPLKPTSAPRPRVVVLPSVKQIQPKTQAKRGSFNLNYPQKQYMCPMAIGGLGSEPRVTLWRIFLMNGYRFLATQKQLKKGTRFDCLKKRRFTEMGPKAPISDNGGFSEFTV